MAETTRKLQAVAYHEAGHAVADYELHNDFRSVSIVPEGRSLGRTLSAELPASFRPDVDSDALTRYRTERRIMAYLAGGEAMNLAGFRRGGCQSDGNSAANLVFYFADEYEAAAYIEWLRRRVRALLSGQFTWPCVQELAAALLTEKTIGKRKARAIIDQARTTACAERMAIRRSRSRS